MKTTLTICGALLLFATTGAYADSGIKLICTRNDDARQWVHVVLNLTKNIAWDDYKAGVAHDAPYRQFALTVVSGSPINKLLGVATTTWGGAVLIDTELTETDGGTVKFTCQGTIAGIFPGDEPHP